MLDRSDIGVCVFVAVEGRDKVKERGIRDGEGKYLIL